MKTKTVQDVLKLLLVLGVLGGVLAFFAVARHSHSSASATTSASSPAPAAGLEVQITSFGPSGHNIGVDFQATNNSGSPQRFDWQQFVLTAPDGSTHLAYRDPASAPYQMVDADGGSYADGGIFQFPTFTPGHYQISYAGQVLQSATL